MLHWHHTQAELNLQLFCRKYTTSQENWWRNQYMKQHYYHISKFFLFCYHNCLKFIVTHLTKTIHVILTEFIQAMHTVNYSFECQILRVVIIQNLKHSIPVPVNSQFDGVFRTGFIKFKNFLFWRRLQPKIPCTPIWRGICLQNQWFFSLVISQK